MNYALDELGMIEASEDELIARIKRERPDTRSIEALSELVRRGTKQVPGLLTSLAGDHKVEENLRVMAIGALGTLAETAEARKALTTALRADRPSIVGRAARVLGRVGSPEVLDSLAISKVPEGSQAAMAIQTARRLITYRFGLDADLLPDPPKEALLTRVPDAIEIKREDLDPELVKRLLTDLHHRQPGIKVAPDGIIAITCAKSKLWLARNAEYGTAKSLKTLAARSTVPMVILKQAHCPERLNVYAYTLMHAGKGRSLKVFAMRPSGVVTHFGSAKVSQESVDFSMKTLNTTHGYALILKGRFRVRGRKLDFETALVSPRPVEGQKSPSVPQPDNE